MVGLLGQVSIQKLKEIPSILCERAADSDDPCYMSVDIVGMVKWYYEDLVCFLFIYLF